ncbi:MAG: NHLP leader peptide family RiPP precursor [Dehalococcoidia bacterium]
MTMPPTPTRRDVELQLIKRAWSDAAFAQQLQENPRQAVEQVLGVDLPEGIAVQVLQETPTTLYLVIPPQPDTLPAGELTDADLADVAGGASAWGSCGPTNCTCGVCTEVGCPTE